MALIYVGGGSAVGTGTTYSVDLTALTGGSDTIAREGDIVVVGTGWCTSVGADADPTMSTSGYTEFHTDLWANDTREANFVSAYKIMGATPDTTAVANGPNDGANAGGIVLQVWRNVDIGTPVDVTATTSTATNNARPDSPAITPVTYGCIIISTGIGTQATTNTDTHTAPTSFTNAISVHSDGSGSDAIIDIASYDGWSSGSYNPAAWTGGASTTSDGSCAASIVLRPKPIIFVRKTRPF